MKKKKAMKGGGDTNEADAVNSSNEEEQKYEELPFTRAIRISFKKSKELTDDALDEIVKAIKQ